MTDGVSSRRSKPLLTCVIAPVSGEDDAEATAAALEPYVEIGDVDRLVVTHVIEKGGGSLDSVPVSTQQEIAADAFTAVEERLTEYPVDIGTRTEYHTDIVDGILAAVTEEDATAIAFVPRGGSRLVDLLTGDIRTRLVHECDRPVIALPGK